MNDHAAAEFEAVFQRFQSFRISARRFFPFPEGKADSDAYRKIEIAFDVVLRAAAGYHGEDGRDRGRDIAGAFSEYLSMYRLNMAKKWLTETDITVKEISDRLRYKNPQNFIRSFKKQEGMTPGQYREKYGNL